MDSVLLVVLCNCAIAVGCLAISVLLVRIRRQLVALTECCDRWTIDCGRLFADAPQSLAASRVQLGQLRQIYRQQSAAVDRIRLLGYLFGTIRSLVKRSTFKSSR